MKSQLYAHRFVSSLMVQEFTFDNPTVSTLWVYICNSVYIINEKKNKLKTVVDLEGVQGVRSNPLCTQII